MLKSDTDAEWVTPGRAALLKQVSSKTIARLADAGTIRSIRTEGGHRRVSLTDVMSLPDDAKAAS